MPNQKLHHGGIFRQENIHFCHHLPSTVVVLSCSASRFDAGKDPPLALDSDFSQSDAAWAKAMERLKSFMAQICWAISGDHMSRVAFGVDSPFMTPKNKHSNNVYGSNINFRFPSWICMQCSSFDLGYHSSCVSNQWLACIGMFHNGDRGCPFNSRCDVTMLIVLHVTIGELGPVLIFGAFKCPRHTSCTMCLILFLHDTSSGNLCCL